MARNWRLYKVSRIKLARSKYINYLINYSKQKG